MFGKDMNSHMNKGNREATAVKRRKATKDHQNKGALWRVRGWSSDGSTERGRFSTQTPEPWGWECQRHRALSATMNQQLKDGAWAVWQLCPSHTPQLIPERPPSRAVLETATGTDGMGWIRILAGTHRGHPGQGRCSTSLLWVPRAQLRSLESPAGVLGAAVAGRSHGAKGWLRGKGLQ